jgi:hypothetical protein
MLERIAELVNRDEWLLRKGRHLDAVFIVDASDSRWRVTVHRGRIERVESGPFVTPSADLVFRAPREAWEAFWQPQPKPGANDLFALLKRRLLTIEGNLQPFMANLFWFKGVLEMPRRLAR